MGNYTTTALIALLAIAGYAIYSGIKKPPTEAVLTVTFAALLFGPENSFIKVPAFPPLDKANLAAVPLFLFAMTKWNAQARRSGLISLVDVFVVLGFFGAIGTALTNGDALTYGSWKVRELPGMTIKDGLNESLKWFFLVSAPFLMGRWFFRQPEHLDRIMRYLVLAGLLQSVFIWLEIRFSPQSHFWLYGYTPAEGNFAQTMRWGGWRPMNFMQHGLALAMFMLVSLLSAGLLTQAHPWRPLYRDWRPKRVTAYLTLVMIFCKSTGAIVYAAVLGPLIRWVSTKGLMRTAVILAVVAGLYPMLRSAEWVPVEGIVEQAEVFGEERAYSLEFRFLNEKVLLEKARERFLFGWGTYGRNSIYGEEMGKELTVADGHWVILAGIYGIVGFIHGFGLLIAPVLALRFTYQRVVDPVLRRKLVGFSVLVAILTFDLIPNGLFSPYPYLLSGALMGCVQEIRKGGARWKQPVSAARAEGPHG